MKLIKKATGAALIYEAFITGGLAACVAESFNPVALFGIIAGCGIALLGGVALHGVEKE